MWWGEDDAHDALVETVEALQLNDVPVLGIIVNGVRRRSPRSYTPYYVPSVPRRPWKQWLSRTPLVAEPEIAGVADIPEPELVPEKVAPKKHTKKPSRT